MFFKILKNVKAYININRSIFILFTEIYPDKFKGYLFDGERLHQSKWYAFHQLSDGQYSFSQYIVCKGMRIYYSYSFDTYKIDDKIKEVQEAYKYFNPRSLEGATYGAEFIGGRK